MATIVTDPVCGMEIEQQKAAGQRAYEGKTYYFCSEQCQNSFDAEPEKYAEKAETKSHKEPVGRASVPAL